MPPYTFTYNFDIGDYVRDLLTGYEGKIIGVSYMNGKAPMSDKVYFHDVGYYVQFGDGYDVRYEGDLQRI